jgi:hypothetical protein
MEMVLLDACDLFLSVPFYLVKANSAPVICS